MKKKLRIVNRIDLKLLRPEELEYWCLTDDIDREFMKSKGLAYDETKAFGKFYFLITKDKRIGIVPGFPEEEKQLREGRVQFDFIDWRKLHGVEKIERSKEAQQAIDWFIKEVHG